MATAALVTRDIQDGQRFLDQLASEGIPVRAASLLKLQNRYKPSLYIATPLVDQKGVTQAYRDVLRALGSLEGVWLAPTDTSLVGENHPLVRDVVAVRTRHRDGHLPPDIGTFGGMAVEEGYVYPPSEAFPGFNLLKQRFPSAEVFTIDLPGDPALPPNWGFHPTVISRVSKVNAQEFEGKPTETLYFVGPRYSRDDNRKQLVFAYRPEGWNTLYDGKSKEWKRVVFEETNQPLYEPADFTPLAELKSPPAAASA
ncbi:MAG: hypothetical protein J0I06_00775 [Planctomycetes bacterium]|nr:hypothetical protein [Planctomycetota bacterium]